MGPVTSSSTKMETKEAKKEKGDGAVEGGQREEPLVWAGGWEGRARKESGQMIPTGCSDWWPQRGQLWNLGVRSCSSSPRSAFHHPEKFCAGQHCLGGMCRFGQPRGPGDTRLLDTAPHRGCAHETWCKLEHGCPQCVCGGLARGGSALSLE